MCNTRPGILSFRSDLPHITGEWTHLNALRLYRNRQLIDQVKLPCDSSLVLSKPTNLGVVLFHPSLKTITIDFSFSQAGMDKQRPLSRAYRSFYSKGKGDGEIVVHLGSGASAKGKAEALQGGESRGGATGGIDGDEMSGTADEIFDGGCGEPAMHGSRGSAQNILRGLY